MNFKMLATISAVVGVLLAAIAGNAIARQAEFAGSGWLMLVFAFGIVLLGQAFYPSIAAEGALLEARLAGGSDA